MQWIPPSQKDIDNAALEKRLWDAADQFRANSRLKAQEYSACQDEVLKESLEARNEEWTVLSREAWKPGSIIANSASQILEA